MTIEEELKACGLVLIHLEDESFVSDFNEHPPFKNMRTYLDNHGYDMINFTSYLNFKYKMAEEPLWVNTAKEFFATKNSRIFYKTIIRILKLELLYQS